MIAENGFWKYGNLRRNGWDRDFVPYAATEPSPANKECDLCGDILNNNSSKMADNKKKTHEMMHKKLKWSNPQVDFLRNDS